MSDKVTPSLTYFVKAFVSVTCPENLWTVPCTWANCIKGIISLSCCLLLFSSFMSHFFLFQDQHSVVGQGAGPTPNSSSCSNPNTGSGYMNSSQQSMLNQQLMEKKQALQRQMMEQKQLLLQQQMLAEAVSFPVPYFTGKRFLWKL